MGVQLITNTKKLLTVEHLFNKYKLLALNIFKWNNLPNGIKSRHIEKALFENGQAIFYDKENIGYICLPSSDGADMNIYGEATKVIANGFGEVEHVNVLNEDMFDVKLDGLKGIRCANNDLFMATKTYVMDYAERMYEVENAININVRQQKFPYIALTDTNNELSVQTFVKEMEEGKFAILKNKKTFDPDALQIINLEVPYVADKLNEYKYELEREILTFFGLNNSYEKKERMLVDEVNSNNDYISRNVELMYKCRQEFCKLVNDYYDLNIEVEKVDLFHNDQDTLKGGLYNETTMD